MLIVVTGAGSGIGYQTVVKLSQVSGAEIIAISRNTARLHALKDECEKEPGAKIIPFSYDLTKIYEKETEFINLLEKIQKPVDILLNNAGNLINKKFHETTISEIKQQFDVNFFAPAALIRLMLPFFNNPSHIVNIGSMGGFQGSSKFPGLSYYSASKAAIAVLTECLAEEYKERNISFNCLALGAVQTEMLSVAFPNYKAPLTAAQMADFISDFALKGNRYFNGKIIPVSLSTP